MIPSESLRMWLIWSILVIAGGILLAITTVLIRESWRRWRQWRLARIRRRFHAMLEDIDRMGEIALAELAEQLKKTFGPKHLEWLLNESVELADVSLQAKFQVLYEHLGLLDRYLHDLRHSPRWSVRAGAARRLGEIGSARAVPGLLDAMRDPYEDEDVKLACARALGMIRDPQAIPFLIEALREPDRWVSPRVAEVLIPFGSLAEAPLIEALRDPNSDNLRTWAASILGEMRSRVAVPNLIRALWDRAESVRAAAARALGEIADPRAVNALLEGTLRDPSALVRMEAAVALGKIGDEKAVEALQLALADPDPIVRLHALEALEMIGPSAGEVLEGSLTDDDPEVRHRTAAVLERLGYVQAQLDRLKSEDAVERAMARRKLALIGKAGLRESLLAGLQDPDFRVRAQVCQVLAELGEKSPGILEALHLATSDREWSVRAQAVTALGKLRAKEALPRLIERLGDDEAIVREAAAAAIAEMEAADLTAFLPQFLNLLRDPNAWIRAAAATILQRIPDAQAREALLEALKDPVEDVRAQAARSLHAFPEARVVSALLTALDDPSPSVRLAAVWSLKTLGAQEAIKPLMGLLDTTDEGLQDAVADALAYLVGDVRALLRELQGLSSEAGRRGAVRTLARRREREAAEALCAFLRDPSARVREAAARALGRYRERRVVEALLAALNDPAESVRIAALDALSEIRATEALDAVMRATRDPSDRVKQHAAVCLGKLGDSNAQAPLAELLNAPPPSVQAAAAIGLALLRNTAHVPEILARLKDPQVQAAARAWLERESKETIARVRAFLHIEALDDLVLPDFERMIEHYIHIVRHSQDSDARWHAVQGLGLTGDARSLELLQEALARDPDARVRAEALRTLARVAPPTDVSAAAFRALRDPDLHVRMEAVRLLGQLRDPKATDPLLEQLAIAEPLYRETIAHALAAIFQKEPQPLVTLALATEKTPVLLGLLRALELLESPHALPVFRRALQHPDAEVRRAGVSALAKLEGGEARALLLAALKDPDPQLRIHAAQVLGSLDAHTYRSVLRTLEQDPVPEVREAVHRLLTGSPR